MIDMSKIDQYVDQTEYTAYEIHKVLNRILSEAGTKEVRPQMMYNYLRNGMIVRGEKIFGETLRKLTNEEVRNFLVRYCLRNEINVEIAETNPDQLELDLEIETSK
jgi:hypothetical protein